MGGMFPSTQPLVLKLHLPQVLSTNVAGGEITWSMSSAVADINVRVTSPTPAKVLDDTLDNIPLDDPLQPFWRSGPGSTGVVYIYVNTSEYEEGPWAADCLGVNGNANAQRVTDSAQWGGLADMIVAIKAVTDLLPNAGALTDIQNAAIQNLPGGDVYDSVDDIHVTTSMGGDLLVAAQDAATRSGRAEQAVMGNTTWDSGTGTVGMANGESFVLADAAGVPVADQSLAVRRTTSTV